MTNTTYENLTIALPAGYTIRPVYKTDLQAVVELVNASSLHITGEADADPAIFAREWETPGWAVEENCRAVIAPDGQMAGYMETWNINNPKVRPFLWGRTHPDHVGKGIGSYLVSWAETRLASQVDEAPEGTQVKAQTHFDVRDQAAAALLGAHGFEPTRHFWRMVIEFNGQPPLAPELPEGITIRSLQPGESEREAYSMVRTAFRDHWGHIDSPFEEAWERWQAMWVNTDDYEPAIRFIALDGDQIVGASLCMNKINNDEGMGWLGTLGVLREYRGRGVAMALLRHTFTEFYKRGKQRVGLGVDAANPTGATRLYERAGMRADRESVNYGKTLRDGVDLTEQH